MVMEYIIIQNRYEEEWKQGHREGYGTYFYSTGDKYEREWKNGLPEGDEIFFSF